MRQQSQSHDAQVAVVLVLVFAAILVLGIVV